MRHDPSASTAAPRPDRPLQGIALMVAGVFLLSVMDTLTKVAVTELSTPVLIAARTAVVMVLITPMVVRAGGWSVLRMQRPLGHLLRGGSPTAFDRLTALRFGAAAVRGLEEGQAGVMVALVGMGLIMFQPRA